MCSRCNLCWVLTTWSHSVHSVVCRRGHGIPAPQTPQGCHWLTRSPPGTGKIPVGFDGFGCWAEGTRALSLPALAPTQPLVVCTGLQPQVCGNIYRRGIESTRFVRTSTLKCISWFWNCDSETAVGPQLKFALPTFSHRSQLTWRAADSWQVSPEECWWSLCCMMKRLKFKLTNKTEQSNTGSHSLYLKVTWSNFLYILVCTWAGQEICCYHRWSETPECVCIQSCNGASRWQHLWPVAGRTSGRWPSADNQCEG